MSFFDDLFNGVQLSEQATPANAWLIIAGSSLIAALRLLQDSQQPAVPNHKPLFLQRNFIVTCLLQSTGIFISAVAWASGFDEIGQTLVSSWPLASGPVLMACLVGWRGIPESVSTPTVGMDRWLVIGIDWKGKIVYVLTSLALLLAQLRFGDIVIAALNIGSSVAMLLGAHRKVRAKSALRRGSVITESTILTPTSGYRTNGYEFVGSNMVPVEVSGIEWKFTDKWGEITGPLITIAKEGNFADFVAAALPAFSNSMEKDGEGLEVQRNAERLEEVLVAMRDSERRMFYFTQRPTIDLWYVAGVLERVQYRNGPRLSIPDERFNEGVRDIGRALSSEYSPCFDDALSNGTILALDEIISTARSNRVFGRGETDDKSSQKPMYNEWLDGVFRDDSCALTEGEFWRVLQRTRGRSIPLINFVVITYVYWSTGRASVRVDRPRPVKSKMEDARMLQMVLEQALWSQAPSVIYTGILVLARGAFSLTNV